MKKNYFVILALSILSTAVSGQGLTLKQCISYANLHNGNLKNANSDVQIAQKKIDEQVGTMLPQIDFNSSYMDNLIIATNVIQAGDLGIIKAKFGTPHNLTASVQLTQKIFDPTFGVALKAVKISKDQAEQSRRKTEEQTAYTISGIYYQTLVIGEQISTQHATLEASEKLLASTELKFKNGMAKQVDVDKIRVSYNNIKSQTQQSELSYKQSLNNLKYAMGMPVESNLALTSDAIESDLNVFEAPADSFNIENRVDYQLQKINLSGYELDKKRNQAGYLPTLSLSANYGESAMRNQFDFTSPSGAWYPSSGIGVTLKIPVFDGLQKHARISQSNLNIEKSKESINLTEQSIKVDLSNYEIQYRNAIDNIHNEKDNLDLAESVYKNVQNQYQQGACSTLDLVQAESSYTESQNNYYSKLLTLYVARINLEQTKGTLINYINKQK